MTGASVQIKGDVQLRATLARAADELGDLSDANSAVAGMVSGRAKSLAPRVSGRLAGSVVGSHDTRAAVVRASVPYAGVIHWGWAARGIAANPFAVNAAHDTEPAWTQTYLTKVEAIIGKIRGA